MGLFEWIGEHFNKGPVGDVRQRDDEAGWEPKAKFGVWILTLIGIGLFGFGIWLVLKGGNRWVNFFALTSYLLVGYWLMPSPRNDNMGWAGGLLDNPFRISDEMNRMLALLALVLLPGKIILYAAQVLRNTLMQFRSNH